MAHRLSFFESFACFFAGFFVEMDKPSTEPFDDTRMRLETGIHQREAIALYEQYGFGRIPAFGHYPDNDISLCYEKRID